MSLSRRPSSTVPGRRRSRRPVPGSSSMPSPRSVRSPSTSCMPATACSLPPPRWTSASGCVRYSYVAPGSSRPVSTGASTTAPAFVSTDRAHRAYAVLAVEDGWPLRSGAENGGEAGALNPLRWTDRRRNVVTTLADYLRLGATAGVIPRVLIEGTERCERTPRGGHSIPPSTTGTSSSNRVVSASTPSGTSSATSTTTCATARSPTSSATPVGR